MSNLKFKFSILPNQQMATSETPGTVTEGEHPKDENGRYTFSIQFVFASKYIFKSYDFPKVFMFFLKNFKFSITFSSKNNRPIQTNTNRCWHCRKKVKLMGVTCRCGTTFFLTNLMKIHTKILHIAAIVESSKIKIFCHKNKISSNYFQFLKNQVTRSARNVASRRTTSATSISRKISSEF